MVLLLYRWQFHQNQGSKRGFLATAAFASGFALAASAMTCGEWWTHGEETNVETNWEDAGFFTWLNHGEQFFWNLVKYGTGKMVKYNFLYKAWWFHMLSKQDLARSIFSDFPAEIPNFHAKCWKKNLQKEPDSCAFGDI